MIQIKWLSNCVNVRGITLQEEADGSTKFHTYWNDLKIVANRLKKQEEQLETWRNNWLLPSPRWTRSLPLNQLCRQAYLLNTQTNAKRSEETKARGFIKSGKINFWTKFDKSENKQAKAAKFGKYS